MRYDPVPHMVLRAEVAANDDDHPVWHFDGILCELEVRGLIEQTPLQSVKCVSHIRPDGRVVAFRRTDKDLFQISVSGCGLEN